MKKTDIRKIIAVLLAGVLLLAAACNTGGSRQQTGSGSFEDMLIILHTNDVHGNALEDLEPEEGSGTIGYAKIAKIKSELEALGASVLLLDAGDASQGTSLVNLDYGKSAFDIMDAVGYDAISPGNHEFDWGSDNLQQLAEGASFPVLSANIVRRTGGDLVFDANKIFEMPNGMQVGVFGLTTPETLTKAHPDKVRDIDFLMGEELYAAAQAQVDELKGAGATVIVCLSHLGMDGESEPNRSIDLVGKVTGIDILIDGHSHTLLESGQEENGVLIASTGSLFKNIGIVTYDGTKASATVYNGVDAKIAGTVDEKIAGVFASTEVDVAVGKIVSDINDTVMEQLSAVFATTDVDLDGERDPGVRTQETNLGDFAADAILWAAKQAVGDQVVAAVTNGGGIRTSIPAGPISMNDMKTVFPFGNQVTVLTITGAELLEALEAATCTTPEAIGAFPQVAGIEFTIDTSVEYAEGEEYPESTYFKPANPGSRVTIATVGGKPFDLNAEYVIASNDFTAAGGDTYYAFRYGYTQTGYMTGLSLEDALVNYTLRVLGGVIGQDYASPAGRITIK
ncbi:MAG: bifunctional metallophosphatase/5'-nucleotidase [Eubacteriaceae bacterium]|nr:bifunctional metallophosphatase/5'-nucleotidase [Eubacteriaceae bacterium]